MTPFNVTILGSSSALPTSCRFSTSQVVRMNEKYLLIDCGEGTQMQLRRYKIRFSRIDHIFISHLHGDHFFGLPGLLSSFSLLGRERDLHIYAHSEIQDYLNCQMRYIKGDEDFKIIHHPLNFKRTDVILDNKKMRVESFPLRHRIPCCGFKISEQKKDPHLLKEMIEKYDIPIADRVKIKEGSDFITSKGDIIPNSRLTKPSSPPRSYAFCTDTMYEEKIIPNIENVNMLYHEATFADDMKDWAEKTYHTTSKQAAEIALKANVGKLAIGHFSARYKNPKILLDEAKSVFSESYLAEDGKVFKIEN
jgi:ribonuclease Z